MSQGQNNRLLLFRFVTRIPFGHIFSLIAELHGPNLCHKSGDLGVIMQPSLSYDKLYNNLSSSPLFVPFLDIVGYFFIYEFKALCPSGKESICSTVSKTLSSPDRRHGWFFGICRQAKGAGWLCTRYYGVCYSKDLLSSYQKPHLHFTLSPLRLAALISVI